MAYWKDLALGAISSSFLAKMGAANPRVLAQMSDLGRSIGELSLSVNYDKQDVLVKSIRIQESKNPDPSKIPLCGKGPDFPSQNKAVKPSYLSLNFLKVVKQFQKDNDLIIASH